jgi:hypothetical protein
VGARVARVGSESLVIEYRSGRIIIKAPKLGCFVCKQKRTADLKNKRIKRSANPPLSEASSSKLLSASSAFGRVYEYQQLSLPPLLLLLLPLAKRSIKILLELIITHNIINGRRLERRGK